MFKHVGTGATANTHSPFVSVRCLFVCLFFIENLRRSASFSLDKLPTIESRLAGSRQGRSPERAAEPQQSSVADRSYQESFVVR